MGTHLCFSAEFGRSNTLHRLPPIGRRSAVPEGLDERLERFLPDHSIARRLVNLLCAGTAYLTTKRGPGRERARNATPTVRYFVHAAPRRLEESLPLGILAYLQQQLADQGFDLRGVDIHRTTPVSRQRLLFAATGRCSLEASKVVNGRKWALWYAVVPGCEPATGRSDQHRALNQRLNAPRPNAPLKMSMLRNASARARSDR